MQTVHLDISDLLNIELRCDNVQTFDTQWDETIIAMQKQPSEELVDDLYFRKLEKSDQLKQLVASYIQDTVKKSETQELLEKTRQEHVSTREAAFQERLTTTFSQAQTGKV